MQRFLQYLSTISLLWCDQIDIKHFSGSSSCDTGELYLAKSLDFIRKSTTEVRLQFIVSDGLHATEGMVSSTMLNDSLLMNERGN